MRNRVAAAAKFFVLFGSTHHGAWTARFSPSADGEDAGSQAHWRGHL